MSSPLLSPSDLCADVRDVLLATGNSLSSYQILDRLPAELRDRLIAERGVPGAGSGNSYSAASVVTDAVELILPSLNAPYRVYLDVKGMTFEVAGHIIKPGNDAIAFYNLPAGAANSVIDNLLPVAPTTAEITSQAPSLPQPSGGAIVGGVKGFTTFGQTTASQQLVVPPLATVQQSQGFALAGGARPNKGAWYDNLFFLWLWVLFFFPVALYGLYNTKRVSNIGRISMAAFSVAWFAYFAFLHEPPAGTTSSPTTVNSVLSTATPSVSNDEQVRQALTKSKSLLQGYQYEAALETLRAVKTLAPNEVLPQMSKVKEAGAKGLTQTAKEIRPKNPGLALEMLNRAAAFGGEEAARLIPRVRRDIAVNEERQRERAGARQSIATYIEEAESLSVSMGEYVSEFGNQFASVKDDPSLLRNQTWRLQTAGKAASVKLTCENIRALKTPEACSDAQNKLRTISGETEMYIDQMLEAVDSVDVDTINSATRHLNRGTAMIPSFRDQISELKREHSLE